MKGYTQNGRFKIELSSEDKEALGYTALFIGVCAFFYFTLIWESPSEKAKNAAINESYRVAREANYEAARKSVLAETETPHGTVYTILHEAHWYTIVGGYRAGKAMNHHPDCPCGKLEKP